MTPSNPKPPSAETSEAAADCGPLSSADPCRSALDGLYRYVDGESSEDDRMQLEVHLRECVGCENVFEFEVQIKRLIAKRGRMRCPDEVRARLVTVIETFALELKPDG